MGQNFNPSKRIYNTPGRMTGLQASRPTQADGTKFVEA